MKRTPLPTKYKFFLFPFPLQISNYLPLIFLLTIFSGVAFALPVDTGNILYVTEFGSGQRDGYSWSEASSDVQAMINKSVSGDQIWVAGGTYYISSLADGLKLKEGVKIYGGFAGTEGSLADRDLTNTDNRSIINGGNNHQYGISSDNGLTLATVLDGFTITGGTSAGIANSISSPTLVNLLITGNKGMGGITNAQSSPMLINVIITGNTGAAGMVNSQSSPILINCAIVNNAVNIGGLVNAKSSPILVNCTIANNKNSVEGVGINNIDNSSLKIRNSIISGRKSGISTQSGSTATVEYCMVHAENKLDQNGFLIPNNVDPLFVNPEEGDYNLQRCSPAVNKGSNTYYTGGQVPDISAITTDLGGNPRFYGLGVVDLGAYEYQGPRMPSLPGVWFVKEDGTGPGLNWECAAGDVQSAINAASSGEQVWVAGGTYLLANNVSLIMKEGVKIYGGFAGTESSLAERNLAITANKSVLRQNGGVVIGNINASLTRAAVLDGFTITGGSGGILNLNSSPMLVNLVITGNTGIGISNSSSSPILINCAIVGNIGTGLVAGMDNAASSPVLTNCTIAGNTTAGPGSAGISNRSASFPKVRNSIIYGNQNGIYSNPGSSATVEFSLVETNKTLDPTDPLVPDIDPLFVNAAGGDYRLQPCSPAINKGFNYYTGGQVPDLTGITTDLNNNPRMREHAVDMGAYEFGGISRALAVDLDEAAGTVSGDLLLTTNGSQCKVLANLSPNGTAALSGAVSAKVWVADVQPRNFLKRHYQISPTTNADNATAKITLYFTQKEFTDFNLASSVKLPVNAEDAENYKANLLIEKRPGVSRDNSGLPNSYTGAGTTFKPSEANGAVEWNADALRWEVSFDVTGFSGFFVKTTDSALPLNLISFTARRESSSNMLQWSTGGEVNTDNFEVQGSGEAMKFVKMATVVAHGSGNHQYSYIDQNNYNGTVYYRLKMSDIDGTFTYSTIISLAGNGDFAAMYPNPAEAMVTFHANNALLRSTATLYDITGKHLQNIVITTNSQQINTKSLASGVYILKFADGTSARFIKE